MQFSNGYHDGKYAIQKTFGWCCWQSNLNREDKAICRISMYISVITNLKFLHDGYRPIESNCMKVAGWCPLHMVP